jgi:glycine/D-amino acid oxidase-like deaminating enzyme
MRILIAGGGVFGVTAALELRRRGHAVTLCDPGPIPHPLAESTDLSKVVRCDYGDDVEYTELGERSLEGWRRWNAEWKTPRFHETGVAFLAREPMQPGGFEHASFELLRRRGHRVERLDAGEIARRFPAYQPGALVDGYFHHEGGWVEAAAVVAELAARARAAGVVIREGAIDRLFEGGALVEAGSAPDRLAADLTIVCAGAWAQRLVPELAGSLRAIGQPVFHLAPPEPSLFHAARFPVFGADIARTGYYGFPLANGVVKIANHGAGVEVARDEERVVRAADEEALRAFVADTFPSLVDAPIVARRLCVYGDTLDGHFWIARHPERDDLVVAAGGSGHAFKFAPVLGELIADALDRARGNPRFRWRPELVDRTRGDAARHL